MFSASFKVNIFPLAITGIFKFSLINFIAFKLTNSVDFCRHVRPCTVIKSNPIDSALFTNSIVFLNEIKEI